MRKAEDGRDGRGHAARGVDHRPDSLTTGGRAPAAGTPGAGEAPAAAAGRTAPGTGTGRAPGRRAAPAGGPHRAAPAAGPEMDALERELTVLYRRARASQGEMARQMHPDLEAAAYGLLVRLAEAGTERATDLCGYFRIGKATMSRQLKALETMGFVSREPDPADGRASLVRLTAEGSARFHEVRGARRTALRHRLSAWAPTDIDTLARLMERMNGDMEA